MTTILTAAGKGAALTPTEADTNFKQGVTAVTTTPFTVTGTHNRNTLELKSGSDVVNLTAYATLIAEDTGDFEVTIKNRSGSAATISAAGVETFDGVDADITLLDGKSITLKAGSVSDDFIKIDKNDEWRGCYVELATDDTTLTSGDAIVWDTEVFDTDGISSISVSGSNSRLTVPSGVTKIRLSAGLCGSSIQVYQLYKSGTALARGGWRATSGDTSGSAIIDMPPRVLSVTAGQYFEIKVLHSGGETVHGNTSPYNFKSWFCMEILE